MLETSKLQQLNSLLSGKTYLETYEVSYIESGGSKSSYSNMFSAKIKGEKIYYLNGSFHGGPGTTVPYVYTCNVVYDSINSLKNVNCSIVSYNQNSNDDKIKKELYDRHHSYLEGLDNSSVFTHLFSTTASGMQKNILGAIEANDYDLIKGGDQLSDSDVLKSGSCFFWNVTPSENDGYYNICFDGDIMTDFSAKVNRPWSSLNQEWHLITPD